jgi:RNA recognition motif-containing protein
MWFSAFFCYIFFSKVIMSKSLYVGNLPWSATEADVRDLFSQYGEVTSVNLITDRETGRARGFGFVEIADADAQKAIEALDNYSYNGRNLKVNESKPREERPRTSRPSYRY